MEIQYDNSSYDSSMNKTVGKKRRVCSSVSEILLPPGMKDLRNKNRGGG